MKTAYTEEQKYIRAKKNVEKMKKFYADLLAYLLVIPFLIYINLKFSPEFQWFWFPMIGWGIGLTFHALGAFNHNLIFGKDWEDRKIKEFMDKDKINY
ncbi:MAG: 2TM domain-containing protein [Lutibacter sp.]|nr:MAG: histidine kinase [Lutibacter sp. BRH_c52]HCE55272.1 histidine kinase [Lutibacter sp.]